MTLTSIFCSMRISPLARKCNSHLSYIISRKKRSFFVEKFNRCSRFRRTLTEKIVAALPKMKCPHLIEPHQIQGLDFINIYPVIQWLVKRSVCYQFRKAFCLSFTSVILCNALIVLIELFYRIENRLKIVRKKPKNCIRSPLVNFINIPH